MNIHIRTFAGCLTVQYALPQQQILLRPIRINPARYSLQWCDGQTAGLRIGCELELFEPVGVRFQRVIKVGGVAWIILPVVVVAKK